MKFSPRAKVTRIAALIAVVLFGNSCQGRGTEATSAEAAPELASAALPELASVGGAQDVWPFEFGLDADRASVEAMLGAPESVSERPAGTEDAPGRVFTWSYPAVEFQFFVGFDSEEEFMLAATITSPDQPLRGGLSVGMSIEDAVAMAVGIIAGVRG